MLIDLRPQDFGLFAQVEGRAWADGSIRIGSCVGAPVFCSTDGDVVTCLVGPDDQSWGIAFAMPRATLPRIVAALKVDA